MDRSASQVREHVVVRILQCEPSDDGRATILDIDTNTGPLRLHMTRPFLHTLIGAASTAQFAKEGSARDNDVPPIVRFLTQHSALALADNDEGPSTHPSGAV